VQRRKIGTRRTSVLNDWKQIQNNEPAIRYNEENLKRRSNPRWCSGGNPKTAEKNCDQHQTRLDQPEQPPINTKQLPINSDEVPINSKEVRKTIGEERTTPHAARQNNSTTL
jgi:hypothetical protein